MQTHVIKVGGENASDPRTAEWLARHHENGEPLAVAISALRTPTLNTTSELLRAQDAFEKDGMNAALPILRNLFLAHTETLQGAGMWDEELGDRLDRLFVATFPEDIDFPTDLLRQSPEHAREQRFIGYGELASAHVLSHILDTRFQVANTLIDGTIRVESRGRLLSELLRDEVGSRVAARLNQGIVIVPGYVPIFGHGILGAYGRGYTDKMAERIAVGLARLGHNPVLHIQKQVPLLSSNPRTIGGTRTIAELSYESAAEITGARGANAQVLNEHTISGDIARHRIPVVVYNPFEDSAPQSTVSQGGNPESGILFVDGREHVSTVTISGFSMSGTGLLERLSHVFTSHELAIDSISSSETEVTFTLYSNLAENTQQNLQNELSRILGEGYEVTVQNNLGLIYCIGDHLAGYPGVLSRISTSLAHAGIDIECISQSRGQRSVTIGVHGSNLRRGVEVLHREFIG